MNLRLKIQRTLCELESKELAEKAGIDKFYYSRIERDYLIPSVEVQNRIAKILNIPKTTLWPKDRRNTSRIYLSLEKPKNKLVLMGNEGVDDGERPAGELQENLIMND